MAPRLPSGKESSIVPVQAAWFSTPEEVAAKLKQD